MVSVISIVIQARSKDKTRIQNLINFLLDLSKRDQEIDITCLAVGVEGEQ